MKNKITLLFCLLTFLYAGAQESYLLVGTYDSPKSEGIYVFTFNSSTGSSKEISHVKTSNPSFLAISPDEKYVYAVNEKGDSTGKAGKIVSYSFDRKTGELSPLGIRSSEGNNPCYITTDKKGKWVIAANYSSGNFAVYPASHGILGPAVQVVQHTGSGPDTARQRSPHVHGIFYAKDNYHLYITDLGTDKIMTYYQDKKTGKVFPSKLKYEAMSPGSGPRHIALYPNGKYVYVANELSASVSVLKDFGSADLQEIQSISALPLTYRGPLDAADIHVSPDGKFLYCSSRRSSNSIAIYKIDPASGMLTIVTHQYTLGESPRNFNFDPSGKFLLVANQKSDEIVIFKRDLETGLLNDTGNRIAVGKPVCIKWITAKN